MTPVMRDAATVLPLRERGGAVEVFMLLRSRRLDFHGGVYVFPGGVVEEADRAATFDEIMVGMDGAAAAAAFGIDDVAQARGFAVGALRELFEEAGILIAVDDDEAWVDLEDGSARAERMISARPEVQSGSADFGALLRAEGLRLSTGVLAHFAHWITPEREKKRFDTHFFLAPAPERQRAAHDDAESAAGIWMTPGEAIRRYRAKEIQMLPPTFVSLEWLSPYREVDAALRAAREQEVRVVLPKISVVDDCVTCLYPADEDYESGIATPAGAGRRVDRLVLDEHGLWARP